ncbi:MAG TPA: histidine kinase, partial [Bacteroidia bacterium]
FRVYKHGLDKEFETFKTPFLFDQLCIDRKNNKWFGTFENGIYLIKSNAPKEIDLNNKIKKGILSLKTDGERLLLLTEKNGLIAKDKSNVKQLFYLEKFKRIRGFVSGKNFKLIGIDGGLYKTDNNFKRLIHLNTDAVKDIEHGFGDDILIGSSSKAHLFRNDTLVRLNDKRTTAICAVSNHEIWMGGLNGIETIQLNAHNAKAKPINIHPIINESHINDIKRDKFGNIWIATNQDGLFQYNNGKVFQFNTSSSSDRSITSDICIEIYPKENGEIWLITNKGISILRSEKNLNLVWKSYNLTSAEGFPIQGISGLAFISNSLFVSTQSGLFEFNKLPIVSNETSATIITKLEVNFNTANMHQLILPYDSNNLTISFASSFINTNSEYAFKFRVKQLGQDWIKTNFLQVPLYNLSPGKYTFEIASLNAHGRAGPVSSIEFTIKKPWYNTWWFVSSISLLIVSIAVYYIKLNRDRLKLNNDLIRQKLRVLRSQMNPHFVFNALSNLQNLVHSKNTVVTNEYIGKLAHIIRKGIEFTDSEFITLDKEIEYTRHYLDIEKTRFGEKFNWELICKIDPNKLQELKVPPLLIQPMAENAIKHAFKSIKTNGFLSISIELSNKQTISYTIKDNGIGISEASMNSTRYGLGIVKERIQLLYKNNSEKGQFSIENINDENTSGTKITILLPKIKNQT